MTSTRHADHPIDPLFLARWSPRAFTAEEIPEATLLTILEAARWAPSSYNAQPWRFLWARRGTRHWEGFVALLNDFNRSWAASAAALVVIASQTVRQGPDGAAVLVPTHAFDAGAAWANLALQATRSDWAAHGMAGFDRDRTRRDLRIPGDHAIEAIVSIGRPGDPSLLPEGLRAKEVPSGRRPLAETAHEGGFPAP